MQYGHCDSVNIVTLTIWPSAEGSKTHAKTHSIILKVAKRHYSRNEEKYEKAEDAKATTLSGRTIVTTVKEMR